MPRPRGVCRLCLTEHELCNSHIIPEFFFKPLYDEKGRYHQFDTDPTVPTFARQKGLREYLFCRGCEDRFRRWETYTSQLFFGRRPGEGIFLPERIDGFKHIGVEYAPLKLFALSVLWRASVSTLPEYRYVGLGRKHEERLRSMLFNEQPGEPSDYGVTLVATEIPYEHIRKSMAMPEGRKHEAEHFYRFMMGGIYWFFVVSSHSGPLTALQARQVSILDDGRVKIYSGGPESTQLVLDQLRAFEKAGKTPRTR